MCLHKTSLWRKRRDGGWAILQYKKALFLFFAVDDSISEEKERKRSGTSGNVTVLLVKEKIFSFFCKAKQTTLNNTAKI